MNILDIYGYRLHLLPTSAIILFVISLPSPLAAAPISNQIIALAISPVSCFITSSSFSFLDLVGIISCPMPTLSSHSHSH